MAKKKLSPNVLLNNQSVENLFAYQVIPAHLGQLKPNPWNPNQMNDAVKAATLQSIQSFGFVIPIIGRTLDDSPPWEIIDGEHRWGLAQDLYAALESGEHKIIEDAAYDDQRGFLAPSGERLAFNEVCPHPTMYALRDHGLIPFINLGKIAEVMARQLTLALNLLHGKSQSIGVANLIAYQRQFDTADYLAQTLAWTPEIVQSYADMAAFDWKKYLDDQQTTVPVDGFEAGGFHRLSLDLTSEEHQLVMPVLNQMIEDLRITEGNRKRALGIALLNLIKTRQIEFADQTEFEKELGTA